MSWRTHYTDMISFSLFLPISSTWAIQWSVSFCISSSALLLVVFADLLVLEQFLENLVGVAADVADSRAMVFQDFVQVLHHILAALFGERRDGHANQLAVVHAGLRPRSELRMAFSIAGSTTGSQD